jgi:hypothetical protein
MDLELPALLATCFVALGQATPAPDYPALGAAFVTEHCGTAGPPCPLEEVLARDHARLDVGPFALEVPRTLLADKQGLEDLRAITVALSTAALEWVRWQGAGGALAPEQAEVWAKWVAHWKPVKGAPHGDAPSRDLVDLLATSAEERALIEGLRDLCRSGEHLSLFVPEGRAVRLILAPTRLEFMRWNGYGGLLDEEVRGASWRPDAVQWMQFWLGWDVVLALEYAPWNGYDPTFKASQPMEKIGKGVQAQHVVQQAARALLHSCRPEVPENRYDSALAMVLTLASCGEINTIEGAGGVSSSGAMTTPYEAFVPGGNPAGGTLPGRSAQGLSGIVESRWRKGHGADGFAAPLKAGQAEGAKAVKGDRDADASATFVLHKEDGTGEHLIHAPFFGPQADLQPYPPADYLVDYAEFFRAYKAGFFQWLATRAPDPETAPAKWTELIRGLATLGEERTFEALAAEVYGLPLSAQDDSTDSLEWRFLRALPKLK